MSTSIINVYPPSFDFKNSWKKSQIDDLWEKTLPTTDPGLYKLYADYLTTSFEISKKYYVIRDIITKQMQKIVHSTGIGEIRKIL